MKVTHRSFIMKQVDISRELYELVRNKKKAYDTVLMEQVDKIQGFEI